MIVDLASHAELNDLLATIIGYDEKANRYKVMIDDEADMKRAVAAMKLLNLSARGVDQQSHGALQQRTNTKVDSPTLKGSGSAPSM